MLKPFDYFINANKVFLAPLFLWVENRSITELEHTFFSSDFEIRGAKDATYENTLEVFYSNFKRK